jgi:predicted enzyme related to lactoylglutathione lyase
MAGSKFVWYELMTTDGSAAAAFYGELTGWKAQKSPMPNMDYTLFNAGAAQVAGAFTLSKEAIAGGAPVAWVGYIGVANVDKSAAELRASGGKVLRGPDDIPGVGRFAMVTDPQGAAFALFSSARAGEISPADTALPGHVGWHELYAGDGATVFDFYGKLFGWVKGDAMDMGPAGKYQMFGTDAGTMIGGMMTKPAQMPVPAWAFYVNVPSIAAAVPKVKAGGGTIANGPTEVPGGQWIVQGTDPQGAHFAMVGAK